MLGICTVNTTLEWIIEKTSRRRDEDICGSEGKPMLMEDDYRMVGWKLKQKGKLLYDGMGYGVVFKVVSTTV